MKDPGVAERAASPDAFWGMAPWCESQESGSKGSYGSIGSSSQLRGVGEWQ